MKCACMGCTEATGRSASCHSYCEEYKEFLKKHEEMKQIEKVKNPYYWSEDREKNVKRNMLNRSRRGRK